MDTERLFERIDRLEPYFRQLWIDLCMEESRSDYTEGVNRVEDILEEHAKSHGLKVCRTPHERTGDLFVLTLPSNGVPGSIAVLGHIDTVHEKGAFGTPPVRIRGDTISGPGAADMKGGVAMALLALEAIRTLDLPHREIRMILNPDEESGEFIGAEDRRAYHEENARGCVAALNCETGYPGGMTVGRTGTIRLAMDVRGITAHSGTAYFDGASAIKEMAMKLLAVEKHSARDGMTFNFGKISGGTVVNIIPASCHAEIDIRYRTAAQREEALRIIREEAEKSYVPGTTAEVTFLHELPAMEETEGNHVLFDLIAAFARENGLEELSPEFSGGASDSAWTTGLGIPTVCSMGVIGRGTHTTGEQAELSSLPRRAKILAGTILSL